MTPANAAIVRANPRLFAPLVRWLFDEHYGYWAARRRWFSCACVPCVETLALRNDIDPDALVELCTTPDMLPDGTPLAR